MATTFCTFLILPVSPYCLQLLTDFVYMFKHFLSSKLEFSKSFVHIRKIGNLVKTHAIHELESWQDWKADTEEETEHHVCVYIPTHMYMYKHVNKYTCIHTYIGTHTQVPRKKLLFQGWLTTQSFSDAEQLKYCKYRAKVKSFGASFIPFHSYVLTPVYELICNVTSRQTLCNVPSLSPKPKNVVSNKAYIVEISTMYLRKCIDLYFFVVLPQKLWNCYYVWDMDLV